MVVSAHAKINLGLHVLRRRPDGFHDLETVFLRIGWADQLRFNRAGDVSMTCSDVSLPTDESNLCIRAVRAVEAATSGPDGRGVHIHLDKHIPHGAGLGGGSSDAALCLKAVRTLWQSDLSDAELHGLAASLGSDVPFFLGSPVALGTGRGEELTPMPFPVALRGRWLAVIVPPFGISTAEAYSGVRPDDQDRADLSAIMASPDLGRWRADLVNDFESHLFDAHPALAHLKAHLIHCGAGYAAMSGSGSAIFGVFSQEEDAKRSVAALSDEHRCWVGPSDAAARPETLED